MEFIIGSASASIASSAVHPVDTIKTQYQETYKPGFTLIKTLYHQHGLGGFYKGLGIQLTTGPIFWGCFFQAKNIDHGLDPFSTILVASTVGSILTNPMFTLKARMQTQNISYGKLIKSMYYNEGCLSFMKGIIPTLMNNFKLVIQFPLFDYFKNKTDSVVVASFASKIIASSIFYPLDLIRIKQRLNKSKSITLDIVKNIYNKNGIRGFYKGVLYYNMVSVPNFVIMMSMKEYLTDKVEKHNIIGNDVIE